MKKAILTAAIFIFATISGQTQTTKILTGEKSNEYGLVYSLPQTALEIEVSACHKVSKKGPYYQYAKKYIGTSDVISEDSENWEITDIKIRPYGVPDSGTQYLMQLKPGILTYIAVDSDGMLLSINKNPQTTETPKTERENTSVIKWPTGKEYMEFVDGDFVASKSSAKQAQLLAESLMEIRESRLSLTRGTADAMPTDGRQLELMLASLQTQEEALSRAFTGSVTTENVTHKFSYLPGDDGKEILFRMSDFAGFVDAEDLSGDPVYIEVKTANEVTLPLDSKGEPKKLPKNAIIYNLPGSADITISILGKTLYNKEILLSQKGITFGLVPELFTDKKNPSYAIFDPVTGALLELGDVPKGE